MKVKRVNGIEVRGRLKKSPCGGRLTQRLERVGNVFETGCI